MSLRKLTDEVRKLRSEVKGLKERVFTLETLAGVEHQAETVELVQESKFIPRRVKSTRTINGKHVMTALAVIFLLISALFFAILFWSEISDFGRFIILILTGGVFMSAGLIRLRKHLTTTTSVLIGTGLGIILIALLTDVLVFHIFPSPLNILVVLSWGAFTLLVAYTTGNLAILNVLAVGQLITNCFLSVLLRLTTQDNFTLIFVLIALTINSLAFIYIIHAIPKLQRFSLFTYSLLMASILAFGFIVTNQNYVVEGLTFIQLAIGLVTAVGIILYIWMRNEEENEVPRLFHEIVLFAAACLVMSAYGLPRHYHLTFLPLVARYILAITTVGGLSIVLRKLAISVPLALGFYSMITFEALYRAPFMFGTATALVVAIYVWERKYALFAAIVVAFHACTSMNVGSWLFSADTVFVKSLYVLDLLIGLGAIAVLSVIFKRDELEAKTIKITNYLFFGAAALLLCAASQAFIRSVVIEGRFVWLDGVIAFALVCYLSLVAYATGYLRNYSQDQDVKSNLSLIIFNLVLYFMGLGLIGNARAGLVVGITVFGLVGVMWPHTRILYNKYHTNKWLACLDGIRYTLLILVIQERAFRALEMDILFSLTGVVLATIAIFIGRKWRLYGVRLYGISLTILMSAKILLFDLRGQNAISRVAALFVCGLLCLGMSKLLDVPAKEVDEASDD
jgi:hypothetical protein